MKKIKQRAAYLIVVALIGIVTACGGGGNGDKPNLTATSKGQDGVGSTSAPTEESAPQLLISEIATNVHAGRIPWVELHNPADSAISLSGFTLRASYADLARPGFTSDDATDFDLPAVTIEPKGYLVIAAKLYDRLYDRTQIVYVRNGTFVPYWDANGSIELVKSNATVDFVRFGSSTAVPLSAGAWTGINAPALPTSEGDTGASMVRLLSGGMADTNSAADWNFVNFATPAGPNDVAVGVVDSDNDGIPDTAKVKGGTYGGLDLYAMGARAGRRDIFVEIDHMAPVPDAPRYPHWVPQKLALKKLAEAFAAKNIALHLDAGPLFSQSFNPAEFNLGGGNEIAWARCIDMLPPLGDPGPDCTSFYDVKARNFDLRRRRIFHYAVLAFQLKGFQNGMAQQMGSDLVLGQASDSAVGYEYIPQSDLNLTSYQQASTLMHEIGHNFGLDHGGNESQNNKPNHYSVMNYMYRRGGLSATPSSIHAAERYYMMRAMKGIIYPCQLIENSPCTDSWVISYSDGTGSDLDENALREFNNIGRGAAAGAYADWDNSNAPNGDVYAFDLNGGGLSVLKDYNEWANLVLPFSRAGRSRSNGNSID